MRIAFVDIVRWADARVTGAGPDFVEGWSIDSRTLVAGDLYFALKGPVHDGHEFVAQAFERGAVAAVVDRDVPSGGTLLRVGDTLRALQQIAANGRAQWGGTVIGVTGSAGKTTTKDIIAHFLAAAFPVGRTVGNLNNHIGVPLSILRLPDNSKIAVLEMGMNHAGEIRELCRIAQPQVGVVTNVGYAHIEFFDSIEGIASAKRELIDSLPPTGTAVLNADDEHVIGFQSAHSGRTVSFGFAADADMQAEQVRFGTTGARFECRGSSFEIPFPGRHGVLNALAGLATAGVFGIAPSQLVERARTIPTGKMRGERVERNGVIILNDAYNANPDAVCSMLDVLSATPARRHIAVLGEMLELGRQSDALHRKVGAHAANTKLDLLIGVQGAARAMLDEATRAGMPAHATAFFDDSSAAGAALAGLVQPGDAILFKGSRGVRVERALEPLMGDGR